jgi:multiple sugar transport system substrate-binding protein
MDISRRQIFALGGGLAALATLAACGQNTGRETTSSDGSKPTLTQWYHEYGEEGVQEAVKRFAAAYPNADVNVVWRTGEYEKAVAAALLTDEVPDVFEYANGPSLDMIKAGQVSDVTDVLGDAKSQFTPRVIERMTFDGKIWAIPQVVDMQMLYYRKSLLENANVKPPSTFAELTEAAAKVKTDKIGGFFAGNDGGVGVLGLNLLWASGLDQFNADRTVVEFNQQPFVDAVVAYREFYDSGNVVKSASDDWYSASAFVNEEAAMQWGGLWSLAEITEAFGDDFGVVPFPSIGDSGRLVVPFGAYGSTIAAKGKNVDAAKAFAKWLWVDQEEKQIEFASAFGVHIPAKPSLFERDTQVSSGPGADAARFVTDYGHVTDLYWTEAMGAAFSDAIANSVVKKADAKKEIDAAAATATAELKRIG